MDIYHISPGFFAINSITPAMTGKGPTLGSSSPRLPAESDLPPKDPWFPFSGCSEIWNQQRTITQLT